MSPYVKINFDGLMSNSLAAGGFVIRKWHCRPILAGAINLGFTTINVGEALIWARKRSLTHFVEGDSKLIIDAICGACEVPWNLRSIIEDIRWRASSFQDIKWGHALKEANFVADVVASVGLKIDNLYIWDACLPVEVNLAFHFDCISSGCVRGFSP
ncbi:uncharacterized protein [Pyrus communis]|uniref:uncharacterized protein n=1 Tax=Pyrus communis TaxID=23211 RepID=UPI0035C0DFB1